VAVELRALRCNTGQLALAITVIIAIKLIKWADRHNQ